MPSATREGKFEDIQTYKCAHGADLRKKDTKSDVTKKKSAKKSKSKVRAKK